MRLIAFTIEGFRAYKESTRIEFNDLTTIIGRNDVGKSTILEALEVFFNSEQVKVEPSDCNVFGGCKEIRLTAEFNDLPEEMTLDSGAVTNLRAEYLTSRDGTLVIEQLYDCSKSKPTCETFIHAYHPRAPGVDNLLELKEKELQAIVKGKSLQAPLKGNPGMRAAIWAAEPNLDLGAVKVPVSKPKEDSKQVWEQISAHLPMFALFQSDRQSRDSDGEVQNPLKGAITTAIAEAQAEIEVIQRRVRQRCEEIAALTKDALQTIDPKLAKALSPKFLPPSPAKWTSLFALGMTTDEDIPLNKRGSGVRRLILVSFFKAEAERKLATSSKANIIYAIEEPETGQHPSNQRILIEAFKEMAAAPNCQIVLTTHSPGLAAELPVDSICYVTCEGHPHTPIVERGVDVFGKVAAALGLVPDSRVQVLTFVEGPTDINALRCLSYALHVEDASIPNLQDDARVAFVITGGSTLKHWVTENYFKDLGLPEVHIYDADVPGYAVHVDEVNGRTDGRGSWATLTSKHEIESYLHPDAILDAFNVAVEVVDHPVPGKPAVPEAFAIAFSAARGHDGRMKDGPAKQKLAAHAFPKMTAARIRDRDPDREVEGWLRRIGAMLR